MTFIGTYCYTNKEFGETIDILTNNKLGKIEWIEYRNLKDGWGAFKEIHDGTCSAPKIVLLPKILGFLRGINTFFSPNFSEFFEITGAVIIIDQ